jgi:hypothetical protein
MTSDSTHTLHRIDVKDQLPRDGSLVLCWGHLKNLGWRWVDVLSFEDGQFIENSDFEETYTDVVTHWAPLESLNWNDGVPLHRSHIQ